MMLKLKSKRGGFSLIEVLVVLVILGVLAGLAIPVFTAQTQKAYEAEALSALDALRSSLIRYFSANSAYTGTISLLDFDPNTTAGGQTLHFSYAVTSASPFQTFDALATRNTIAGGAVTSTVQIEETGQITRTTAFL
jgi:prepilin-type N-terminal cleavage/methylation domain-containing protein